jgi:hypothetical protein
LQPPLCANGKRRTLLLLRPMLVAPPRRFGRYERIPALNFNNGWSGVRTDRQDMENIVVKDSPIHGRGVFAARRIEAGEVIIDGCRELLSDEAVKALPREESIFLAVMDGQNVLMKPPARFVNHSCNPNARGTERHDVAIRVIEAGEEVTVDYVAEQLPGLRLECNCKAPNCRELLIVPSRSEE